MRNCGPKTEREEEEKKGEWWFDFVWLVLVVRNVRITEFVQQMQEHQEMESVWKRYVDIFFSGKRSRDIARRSRIFFFSKYSSEPTIRYRQEWIICVKLG